MAIPVRWVEELGVKGVIVFLPILLEAELAFFLVGLMSLLWILPTIMAVIVIATLFYFVILILLAFSAVDYALRMPVRWTLQR